MTSTDTPPSAASWDLTSLISPYLDLHMMFPLLEYVDSLISSGVIPYASADVAAARLSLLRPTNMVDYAMDIYRELHGEDAEIPMEMEDQKKLVLEKMEKLKAEAGCKAFEDLCQNQELRAQFVKAGQWNITEISKKDLGITTEVIETYRQLAKFNFDCGDYRTSCDMLSNIISLYAVAPLPKEADDDEEVEDERHSSKKQQTPQQKTGNPNVYFLTSIDNELLQLLWGKLSCEILVENWEEASIALTAVKLSIEQLALTKKISALEALKQRTWLLHWSLFVFWNNSGSKGLEAMVELFFSEKYLQAITTNAPHLLRYLTAAVLLCKRRVAKTSSKDGRSSGAEVRKLMKDLVRVMQNCEYSDPIVEFVDCLCVKFDFEGAQTKLVECETVLSTDFFLCKQTTLFMEEARVFVFENYCRIHDKIDLNTLADKLAMDQEAAERWIVDLIRNALLDAKIDSEEGCVIMGTNAQSVYEKVMGRTRDLNIRSATMVQNLKNVVNEAKKTKARNAKAALEEEY
jgi:translation initiation factor 3 subunit E